MIPQIIRASSVPLAMLIVGALGWHAASMGINGALFMTVVAVIGGLGGYEVKKVIDTVRSKSPPSGK